MFKIELDLIDELIVDELQKNARKQYTEIAAVANVSAATVHGRVKKLERLGVIEKISAKINYNKLGYDITCFLGIFLAKSSFYKPAIKQLEKISEVVSVHYTTGQYSMFVKLICKDTAHLRNVLSEKIQIIDGIQRTETLLSLEKSINRPLYIKQ